MPRGGKQFKGNRIGANNPNWKGGTVKKKGYIMIHKPEHPYANSRGYVREHRYIYELMLGRYLKSDEAIHHIDGNRENNDPMNLQLFETKGKHISFHKSCSFS